MKISWGIGTLVVYVLFALSTVGFVVFASMQNHDLVRTDYYEESLRRSANMEAESNASHSPTRAEISCSNGTLSIKLGTTFRDTRLSVNLARPASANEDILRQLRTDSLGNADIDVRACSYGKWIATLEWSAGVAYRDVIPIYLDKVR